MVCQLKAKTVGTDCSAGSGCWPLHPEWLAGVGVDRLYRFGYILEGLQAGKAVQLGPEREGPIYLFSYMYPLRYMAVRP